MSKRGLAFTTVLTAIIAAYLVVVAVVLEHAAVTSADHAVVTLVKVLLGAAVLVTLGLLAALARLDDETAGRPGEALPTE